MHRIRLPLTVIALGIAIASPAFGQEQPEDRRSERQIADSIAIAALALDVVGDVRGDSARAGAIYEWVSRNVGYDANNFFRGGKSHEKAEDVYRHRSALCGGFVSLYARMAREVGLTAVPITGYAKGVDYVFGRSTKKANHAWLAMHIGGEWRLIDPTWGAGVISGRTFEPRFTWDFFLVSPEELILSHYPEEAEWQLVKQPLDRRQFERMRAVPRTMLRVGFDPNAIRATALAGATDFPLVGTPAHPVRVLAAPISGTLAATSEVVVDLVWPGASEVVVVTNGAWTRLSRTGDRFRGAVRAGGTSVSVIGRGPSAADYQTLLHYRVTGGGRASSR